MATAEVELSRITLCRADVEKVVRSLIRSGERGLALDVQHQAESTYEFEEVEVADS